MTMPDFGQSPRNPNRRYDAKALSELLKQLSNSETPIIMDITLGIPLAIKLIFREPYTFETALVTGAMGLFVSACSFYDNHMRK